MAYLVTGGCGFVGSNVVAELMRRDECVVVIDNLSREGASANLSWLHQFGNLESFHIDVRNCGDLEEVFRKHDVECVFHLAGQVAMTTSLENPRTDFEINVLGSINVLECVRLMAPHATVVYASSNKVYGTVDQELIETSSRYEPAGEKEVDEDARMEFRTPYGCSKGAADQYMLDYARCFGLNTVVLRHSTIYGGRQMATVDQGWVGWFCQKAMETLEDSQTRCTINGDGKQVRDLLHVSDAVACYLAAHGNVSKARGEAMNIGGGYKNSQSLLELLANLAKLLGVKMNVDELPWRAHDQRYFVSNNAKAAKYLDWTPTIGIAEGIADAVEWERTRRAAGVAQGRG